MVLGYSNWSPSRFRLLFFLTHPIQHVVSTLRLTLNNIHQYTTISLKNIWEAPSRTGGGYQVPVQSIAARRKESQVIHIKQNKLSIDRWIARQIYIEHDQMERIIIPMGFEKGSQCIDAMVHRFAVTKFLHDQLQLSSADHFVVND